MKSFWVSVLIFCLLIAIIAWNSVYIHRVCKDLTETAEALPTCGEGAAALAALTEKWEQESTYMELSVSHHSIDKINDCLYEWQSAVRAGDEAEYERCRYLFLSVINQILRAEGVTISNWI